jgi:hypothetical protein
VTETLYDHAGGDEGLHRLEQFFNDKVLADPVLETLFTERVPTHVVAGPFSRSRYERRCGWGRLLLARTGTPRRSRSRRCTGSVTERWSGSWNTSYSAIWNVVAAR